MGGQDVKVGGDHCRGSGGAAEESRCTTAVQAARAGGFGLIIGVDRGTGRETLERAGADIVVSDLTQLLGQRNA